MPRRIELPGASELFRPTAAGAGKSATPPDGKTDSATGGNAGVTAGGSGRVRHEEKFTVYVSREELLALEQARLQLRSELGLAVDRGRLVRAAMSLALADLAAAGGEGELVRRLMAS